MHIRNTIQPNQNRIRLDRNECIHTEAVSKILKHCIPDKMDVINYKTPYDFIFNLAKIFNISQNNIYVDSGSEAVIKNIIITFSSIKTWVIQDPTFEMFTFYCKNFGKTIRKYSEFPFRKANILSTKFEGIYLVSPHNPTGRTYSVEEILDFCKQSKLVLLDMAYSNPIKIDERLIRIPNLIIIKSFSKMGGMAGSRLGFCIANEKLIKKMNQLRPMFINSFTLKIGEYLTSDGIYLLEKIETDFENERNKFINSVCSAANFVLLEKCESNEGKRYIFDDKIYYRKTLVI